MKILLVDDTQELLNFYKFYLNTNFPQYEVVTADNAEEAIKTCAYAKEEDFLCVITDYEMTENMSGADLSAHIRCAWKNVPIFLHTNTCVEAIPELRQETAHMNIQVHSKQDSMTEIIKPWIDQQQQAHKEVV